ncbi:ATPase [Phocaeicola sp.]|uniref:ATPase n=1 Tax=Phocaeicola sp. TaxID=2773926 RepID=UPI0023BEE221|nr:ATPase [Phocaeicola sp.]MDE5678332.1 ATPase [Phocaeicola sp.]
MIVIADSGATKTDWCLGNSQADSKFIRTEGINPFHQSADEIRDLLASSLIPRLEDKNTQPETIYFYGAGCTPDKAESVRNALSTYFPQSLIRVESDLTGAARALCGTQAGIACILGTGSNSCAYDGEKITANVPPLGYILGDEGSGAALGKRLASDCLKRQLPDDLCQSFFKECRLTPAQIQDRVYRHPLANRFLASLTPFLSAHRHRTEIQALLQSSFTNFFIRNVMQYEYHDTPVHFAGSIAFHFQEEVKEAARQLQITVGRILKEPMKGLMEYHFDS